jgi:RES domain-containing protein
MSDTTLIASSIEDSVPKHPDLFFDRTKIDSITKSRVRWKTTYRLQSDHWPPIAYFERIAEKDDHPVLDDLEKLTNRAARQTAGKISLVPAAKRVFGPGASLVMAPFVYTSRENPNRFSDGSYGVYYAGKKFETALREVAFHRARFHSRTKDVAARTGFKTITATVDKAMHDLRKGAWPEFLDPDPARYAAPQSLGAQLKETKSHGIVYPSVRHSGGECIGVFWPNILSGFTEGKHVALQWDGAKIAAWFDYETGEWSDL